MMMTEGRCTVYFVITAAILFLFVEKSASQDCGTPPYLLNGAYTLPTGTATGDVAVYTCNEGYGIVGSAAVECLNTGVWGSLPTCSRDCGTPISIENGNFVPPSNTLMGSQVVYSCNPGYSMVGGTMVVCQSSGRWGSAPGCQIVMLAFNETCFTSEGCVTRGATCRPDNSSEDRCLCAESGEVYDDSMDYCLKDCGILPNPVNGLVTLPEKTSEGQVAVYTCVLGFTLSDINLAIRTCLPSGEWSMTAPDCIVGCVKPPPPKHGHLNESYNRAAGDTIYYGCDPGYMLVGVKSRVCRDDTTWSGNEPVCLIECPVLAAIEDGSVDISNGYWEDSVATYICNKDYALVGSSTRVCKSTGEWSGLPPTCIFGLFPDALLVCSCLLLVVVMINILIILFLFYLIHKRRNTKTWDSIPSEDPSEEQLNEVIKPLQTTDEPSKTTEEPLKPAEKTSGEAAKDTRGASE